MGALSLFLCNETLPSEGNGRHPKCVLLMFSLLLCLVLVLSPAENPTSHRLDVGNGNSVFSIVLANSGCPAMTLIQKIGRLISLNTVLRPPSFVISSSWSSSTVMLFSAVLWTKWVSYPFLGR